MKKVVILLLIWILMISINQISLGTEVNSKEGEIYLLVSKQEIQNDEEFSITINLANIEVSAFDLNIFFNKDLLEYISGPENTNVVEGKIITSWYDSEGGKNPKQNCELVKYTFKSKKIESELISIEGEFYNSDGELITDYTEGVEIISNENKETEEIEISENSNIANNNSELKILRLDKEGITPTFSPDIFEYYFLTDKLDSLEVTAIPENTNSNVEITGNTNFKEGLNTINITVTSADGSNKNEYKIYVTKTKDIEKANANLETLAIENVELEPQLIDGLYEYKAVISENVENLNILAIPQDINANVSVNGNQNLKYGNNQVTIDVVAENGYTSKKYIINVYRRNKEEQEEYNNQQEYNAQKLNTIIEKQEEVNIDEENDENNQNQESENTNEINNKIQFLWVIAFIIVIVIIVVIILKRKEEKNNK